jgi:hypothetical protein
MANRDTFCNCIPAARQQAHEIPHAIPNPRQVMGALSDANIPEISPCKPAKIGKLDTPSSKNSCQPTHQRLYSHLFEEVSAKPALR